MSPIPSPGDLAAANKPVTAGELRRKYMELFDGWGAPDGEPTGGDDSGVAAAPAVEKLEAAHQLLHDALSERNN